MSVPENNESSSPTAAALVARPAIKLDRVETWKLRGEHWADDEELPEWAKAEQSDFEVSLLSLPESRIGVTVLFLSRDELPRAVTAQIAAIYYLADLTSDPTPPESGNVQDTAAYIRSLGHDAATGIVNQGIADITPYMRELVHSISARLPPYRPIAIKGLPAVAPGSINMSSESRP
jgi:hypothetical protein